MVMAVAKLVCERWQESHFAIPAGTGMWPLGFPRAEVPLWQVSQVPVPTALAGECEKTTLVSQLTVDRWQDSQFPVTALCVGVAGLLVRP